MDAGKLYLLAADAILLIHFAFVVFVVLGLGLILAGKPLGWRWVRNIRFRVLHLAAIGYVVAQAWLGRICPLTLWEMQLRERAGDSVYAGSFVAHWLQQLIYYDAPQSVFLLLYTLFGVFVAASWFWVRPRR